MPTVAGLHAVLEKLVSLPTRVASQAQKAAWEKMKARVPPLPMINGSYWACDDCTIGGNGPGQHKTSNVSCHCRFIRLFCEGLRIHVATSK